MGVLGHPRPYLNQPAIGGGNKILLGGFVEMLIEQKAG